MTKTISLSKKKSSRLSLAKKNTSRLASRARSSRGQRPETVARRIAKGLLVVSIGLLLFSLVGSVLAFQWLHGINAESPSLDNIFDTPPTPSIIYDRNGKELYKVIGDVNSDPVNIDEIPEYVRWAFLAAEDVDFYTHNGFDTAGMIRCGILIVQSGGGSVCGGSTVTQQLIKMTALADETNKVERKIKELFMATNVEQRNAKEEILQMYLTVAPFGGNVVGIETAAEYYFRKSPGDLTLAEAAALASIVQNPAYLSPTNPVDGDTVASQALLRGRQMYVLEQMELYMDKINDQILLNERKNAEENGVAFDESQVTFITPELLEESRLQELAYQPPVATNKLAGNFVDFTMGQLQEGIYKDGEAFSLAELQNGGYRIYTTLDYEVQQIAEQHAALGGNDYKYLGIHNAAVMTMQPSTGEIISMAGSKDFNGQSEGCDANGANCLFNPQVNILTTPQSPGSTNKMLGYYKAFELGLLYPGSLLPDVPINEGNYVPKNWDNSFRGVLRTAEVNLRESLNIPALTVLRLIGLETYLQESEEWGYTTYEKDENGNYLNVGSSVILGGTDIIPVEHAAAYGVLANQGDYVVPQSILRIEDKEGNIVFEHTPEKTQVASPQAAFILNKMMQNLGEIPSWDGRDIAAKTGTTENNRDSWIAAYSPDFVSLAWAGNNNNIPTTGWASTAISPWFKQYMAAIGDFGYFAGKNPFTRPGFITQGGGGCNEEGECLGLSGSWMIEGVTPPSYYSVEKLEVCTDQPDRLARPIDKALGLAEERSFYKFKMAYEPWQGFVDDYLQKNGTGSEDYPLAPKDSCDIDRGAEGNGPLVVLESPKANQQFDTSIAVSGRGVTVAADTTVTAISVYLGNTYLGAISSLPNFNESFSLQGLGIGDGVYDLRFEVEDSSGNVGNTSVRVRIGDATGQLTTNFTGLPPNSLTYGTDIGLGVQSYPIASSVQGSLVSSIANAQLYQIRTAANGTSEQNLLGTMSRSGNTFTFDSWGIGVVNEASTYQFLIEFTLNDGRIVQSDVSSGVQVQASTL